MYYYYTNSTTVEIMKNPTIGEGMLTCIGKLMATYAC